MGHDHRSPWANLKRPLWQCLNRFPLDAAAANSMRLQLHTNRHLHTERWVFATHRDPLKLQALGGILGLTVPPPVAPALSSTDVRQATGGPQERRFLIFDQSGSRTTMIFSSVGPAMQQPPNGGTVTDAKQGAPLPLADDDDDALQSDDLAGGKADVVVNRSDDDAATTCVSQGSKRRDDGENEETDGIDALLYSDSEEEEGNAAAPSCSPDNIIATAAQVDEEVASSGGPSKRRKLDGKMDDEEALMDTASSTTSTNVVVTMPAANSYSEAEDTTTNREYPDCCSCVKGSRSSLIPKWAGADHERNHHPTAKAAGIWKMKRDQIRETVNVLRGIIPGCTGKDACLVLDEAIRYLKSLELKVQTLGGTL